MEENLYTIDNKLYLSFDFLKVKGVPKKTIINGLSKNACNKSRLWKFIGNDNNYKTALIDFDSIPINTLKKYKIPDKNLLIGEEAFEKSQRLLNKKNKKLAGARLGITHAYQSKWEKYSPLYFKHVPLTKDKIKFISQTHAVFEEIIQLQKEYGHKLKDLFTIYQDLDDVVFKCKSLNSFYRKLNEAQKEGIRNALMNKALGRKRENIKLSKLHKLRIKELYRDPKKFSYRHITDVINLEMLSKGYTPISLSTIKKFLRDPIIQNECKIFRNGDKYAKENLVPYLVRLNAKNAGDQWQIDGSRFQFMFEDEKGKIGFLTLFVVLDIYSKKIVGFSLDDQENTKMIFQALQRACDFTKCLPAEVIHDNFSVYSTQEFKNLVEYSSLMGVKWRPTSLGNSSDKGHVERFFQTFQSEICKPVDGYVGEGIRSKRENGHPAPHLLDQYRKKKHLRDRSGLILLADELIFEYNSFQKYNGCPNIKYENSEKKNVVSLSLHQISILFWKMKQIKVHRSMIKIIINKQEHFYTIWDAILSKRVNNTVVKVRYNEKETQLIYIFDEEDNFLAEIKEDVPVSIASINQTDDDKISIRNFAEKRKIFLTSFHDTFKQEKDILSKEYGEYDLKILNPETASKTELESSERRYTLQTYGINPTRIKKITPVKIRVIRSTGLETNLQGEGPFIVKGNLSIIDTSSYE